MNVKYGSKSVPRVKIVNTRESVHPVYDKHYHTNKRLLQKLEVIVKLRNYALYNIFGANTTVVVDLDQ